MDAQFLLTLLLAIPFGASILIWLCPSNFKMVSSLHVIASAVSSFIALNAVAKVMDGKSFFAFNDMLFLDALGGVFLTLIAVTGLLVNLYAIKYMQWEIEKNEITAKDARLYFSLAHLFIFTMTFSVVANNIVLMWVAIEATTLSSVFMVAIHKGKKSTESGWKYIVICSIGLAFALYATVLLYSAGFAVIKDSHSMMLWTTLMAHSKEINPDILKLIFVFALIGLVLKQVLLQHTHGYPMCTLKVLHLHLRCSQVSF